MGQHKRFCTYRIDVQPGVPIGVPMSLHPELFAACIHKAQLVTCLTADMCDSRSSGCEFDPI